LRDYIGHELNPQDLEKIAHLTLEHYNQYAEEFWQGTRDHDVSQNIAALLQYIRNEPPFKSSILVRPGRDSRRSPNSVTSRLVWKARCTSPVMARAYSGCEVWQQDFLKLDLPDNHFDGVFANARAVSCTQPGAAARAAGTESKSETWRCSLSSNPRGHTRKAGARGATACIMILKLGAAICRSPGSSS